MKPKYSMPSFARASILIALLLVVGASVALAQAAARLVGTITAIDGNTLTVKTDAGEEKQVTVPAETAIKRLEPGQSLAQAAAIALSDLAVNDRVLMKLDTSATPPQATMIVAMKHSDVAQRQEKEREAWQQGIAGLVKKVDPAANTILVATGAGPTARNVTVHLTQSTQLLRYSPQSVNFADARPGPLDAIKPGDQLRARGALNADKTEIAADAIVSGTFRNVSGLITQVDPTNGAITVKDLATKKPVTVHVPADVQMRRIPERMAQMLAMRLKGAVPARDGNGREQKPSPAAGSAGARFSIGQNPGGAGGDMQRMLSFAPAIKLTDLQKGDAVMIVATDGTSEVNAITLLAGVEPLLEAPEATNLLSNWSMGGGGAEAAAGPQ